MKFIAAYLLAQLGAASAAAAGEDETPATITPPGKDDVRRILESIGANVEDDRMDLLFAELEGRDFAKLIAAGRERLAYAPCAGAGVAGVGAGAPASAAAGEAKEEELEEDKMEEEDDENMFSLFDD